MPFKHDWEKTETQHKLPTGIVEKMLYNAWPDKKLISWHIISGGCANINIKFIVVDTEQPFILRIYLRDPDAAYREQKIGVLLKNSVPVPLIYYIGDCKGYRFAIIEFLPGITLRDLLLSHELYDLPAIMHEAGETLGHIAAHTFSTSGFFDKDLRVMVSSCDDSYQAFAQICLQDKMVMAQLPAAMIAKIIFYWNEYGYLFPEEKESRLVHGDFDPSNILVSNVDNRWKVTAVLDWEFAFSGSVLCDMANMLRYAHHMPALFKESFLGGLQNTGICLPKNWQLLIHMINLVSLLDCLKRAVPKNAHRTCADIRELIDYILKKLDESM